MQHPMTRAPIDMGQHTRTQIKREEDPSYSASAYNTPQRSSLPSSRFVDGPLTTTWDPALLEFVTTTNPPTPFVQPSTIATPFGQNNAASRFLNASHNVDHPYDFLDQPISGTGIWRTPLSTPWHIMDDFAQGYITDQDLAEIEWQTTVSSAETASALSFTDSFFTQPSSSPETVEPDSPWLMTPAPTTSEAISSPMAYNNSPLVTRQDLPGALIVPAEMDINNSLFDRIEMQQFTPTVANAQLPLRLSEASKPTAAPQKSSRDTGRAVAPKRTRRVQQNRGRKTAARSPNLRQAASIRNITLGTITPDFEDELEWLDSSGRSILHYCSMKDNQGQCTASFKRREHLRRHELKHTGAQGWRCPLLEFSRKLGRPIPCRKACSRHDNYMDHVSKHCRAWLTQLFPARQLRTRSYAVSIADAEALIVESECGPDPGEEQLRRVQVMLWQLVGRLKKDFPNVPDEILLFPMLRRQNTVPPTRGRGRVVERSML